jgi:hypothetical protein
MRPAFLGYDPLNLDDGGGRGMDTVAWGVMVMLPGVLAALAPNRTLKFCSLAVSALLAVAAVLGVFS